MATKKKTTETDNMSDNKEVAVAQTAGAVGALADYAEYAGQGFENQTAADYKMPFLALLQVGSPQCIGKDPIGKAGMLFDTAGGEVFDGNEGVLFVPATTEHAFVAWKPGRGGFAGKHAPGSAHVLAAKRVERQTEDGIKSVLVDADGNDLVETFYIYGTMVDEKLNPLGGTILANTSSKIGPYKEIMGKIRKHLVDIGGGKRINPPMFANLIRVKSVWDTKFKKPCFNFQYEPARGDILASMIPVGSAAFQAAVELKKMVESGLATPDMGGAPRGEEEVEKPY